MAPGDLPVNVVGNPINAAYLIVEHGVSPDAQKQRAGDSALGSQ